MADLVAPVPQRSMPPLPSFPDARLSAVLIALYAGEHGAEVLLTRRSMLLRNHKGEISFPGGRMDPGETPIDTALREAHEEVDLDPSLPTVVGELAHLNTVVSRSYSCRWWRCSTSGPLTRRPVRSTACCGPRSGTDP